MSAGGSIGKPVPGFSVGDGNATDPVSGMIGRAGGEGGGNGPGTAPAGMIG